MDLLERYLKQLEKYLPLQNRRDFLLAMKESILNEVEDDSEEAMYNTLQKFGSPKELARKTSSTQRLFSNELEPILELVIKLVSITLPFVVLFAHSIEYVLATPAFTCMDLLLDIALHIPTALSTLLLAYGIIFIVFYMIQRYIQPKFEIKNHPFDPHSLPIIPKKELQSSVIGSVLTVLLVCFAIYVFNYHQGLIGININGEVVPLLKETYQHILFFMNINWFITIVLHIYYLYKRQKTIPSKIIELLNQLFSGILLLFIATADLLNETIIETYNLFFLPHTFQISFIILGSLVIMLTIAQYIKLLIQVDHLQ